ncbi:MAG: TatD family hydrolase [Leptonema sp. (in: Bacteria)]|nr:TatD family hydrolase [Leptonema sp. (in: bacteria)]
MIIDTHCHLDIIEQQGISAKHCLTEAESAGLEAIIQIGTDLQSSQYNDQLAKEWNVTENKISLYWAAGLHPENADNRHELVEIEKLVRKNRERSDFAAIGEIGLDYFHSNESGSIIRQKEAFDFQASLAAELDLPIIVHTRDDKQYIPGKCQAILDTLETVKKHKDLMGVLHCFTYSYEEAMPFVDLGWKISFSGIVTFPKSNILQEAVIRLPLNSLMVETDAPFLAPVPFRGKTNQPAYVAYTLDFVANLRSEKCGESIDQVRAKIHENSLAFIATKDKNSL